LEAERRQVLVLFADMVGFTAFSERLCEEAAFGLVQSLSQIAERVVQVEGVRIHSIAGDGVMVVFGGPAALEDGPLQACRAARSILASLKAPDPGDAAKPAFTKGGMSALALSGRISLNDCNGMRPISPAAERGAGMVKKAIELAATHGWFLTRQFPTCILGPRPGRSSKRLQVNAWTIG
jgi:Adenylate and Guanylate cyclase catalytic domain